MNASTWDMHDTYEALKEAENAYNAGEFQCRVLDWTTHGGVSILALSSENSTSLHTHEGVHVHHA